METNNIDLVRKFIVCNPSLESQFTGVYFEKVGDGYRATPISEDCCGQLFALDLYATDFPFEEIPDKAKELLNDNDYVYMWHNGEITL